MTQWQPLSVRQGRRDDSGPFEGIPDHLKLPLVEWFRDNFRREWRGVDEEEILRLIALRLHVSVRESYFDTLLDLINTNEDLFLDVIDMGLQLTGQSQAPILNFHLQVGGSVWQVAEGNKSLVRRVPTQEQASFEAAVAPADEASEHLAEAWTNVYGRHPNTSDAWDHAIKAVEALLWGLVIPKNTGATLGTILAALANKPSSWTFRLASSSKILGNVETLEAVLRLIWPNPDRHGSGTVRMPTQDEAENVVQTAIMIVGWLRTGAFVKNR